MTVSDGALLALENLTVDLPGAGGAVRAVNRVSLRLEPGKTLALVGESGCGKSTLCRAVMGMLPPRSVVGGEGRILFQGRDLAQLKEQELRRLRGKEIGIVLQNPMSSLNPVLTVGMQIAEPMLHHLGFSRKRAEQRVLELLQAVGISQPEQRMRCYPHQLSGGMRQRVAIAIALSCEPKLLIADEPTTALDVTVQAEILNLLARLQREQGMALLLVTHDLGVVAGRAEDTAVMYAGRVVERARTLDLFARMRMHYTKALFEAVPRLEDPPNKHLKTVTGQPPDLSKGLDGCPFAPRCPRAEDRCRTEEPSLARDDNEEHHYACWFPASASSSLVHSPSPCGRG